MTSHDRLLRGRDAIAAVLESLGLPADEARSRAGNCAQALGGLEYADDPRQAIADALDGTGLAWLDRVDVRVLSAWTRAERAPGAGEATR